MNLSLREEMKVVTVLPSSRRAVGVEVVNGSELQVVNRSIAVKAIALTPTVITNAVPITFIECITP